MTIQTLIQGFDLGQRVTLYEIDLTIFGEGIFYIAPGTEGPTSAVYFGGQLYSPHPVLAEGFEMNSAGPLPRPRFAVSNLDDQFTALVEEHDDLTGGVVRRIRTFGRYLDSGSEPDGDMRLPDDIYEISRKVVDDGDTLEWELSALTDQEGSSIPGRRISRDYCDHSYRRWEDGVFNYEGVTCPYDGSNGSFDVNDEVTTAPNDRCAKRLTSCKLRFGENAKLGTRAAPGVSRLRVR